MISAVLCSVVKCNCSLLPFHHKIFITITTILISIWRWTIVSKQANRKQRIWTYFFSKAQLSNTILYNSNLTSFLCARLLNGSTVSHLYIRAEQSHLSEVFSCRAWNRVTASALISRDVKFNVTCKLALGVHGQGFLGCYLSKLGSWINVKSR